MEAGGEEPTVGNSSSPEYSSDMMHPALHMSEGYDHGSSRVTYQEVGQTRKMRLRRGDCTTPTKYVRHLPLALDTVEC